MLPPKILYQNRLPHIAPLGACFFVTFRLGDSLPQPIVSQLRHERDTIINQLKAENPDDLNEQIYQVHKHYFRKFDHQLDQFRYGRCYLRQVKIAEIVIEQIHQHDGKWYELQAYCIMPNHVHLLLDTGLQIENHSGADPFLSGEYVQLDRIMQSIKGTSSRYSNQFLNRTGTFWQKDSYDHFVRDPLEWSRIRAYILNNPVKAGLVDDWEKWEASYCKYL
jgi:putative transposase